MIATIAFGMEVDRKVVHRVIHYEPSKNAEVYIQETGRAGRDSIESALYTLFYGILLSHVDGHMKEYVQTQNGKQRQLLKD